MWKHPTAQKALRIQRRGEEMGVGRKDKGKDKKRTARGQDHIHRKSNKGDEVEETQETNEVKPEPQRFKPSVY